ncbi:probable leucine--tRNA ligase, mitochondrial [Copidosoma floridanum]|uniref:probable leucine--tRNA ligase, mitochondrial n=1 Tax=Copidosoma floridanum TaxID=29053 RepID=UPI0006C9D379|nr:probable leucine--tRNA ligase, mitochondrial [Copidosoma floridanum]
MKYTLLLNCKWPLVNKNLPKCVLTRQASTGLNLWNEELTTEYKHQIENYWKDKIHKGSNDNLQENKEKFYVLSMFPYPSGSLHMGHVRVYAISDSVARFYRMKGKNVIHPMGWDAFGLPAENAAKERQVNPAEWTKQNIQNMREQLLKLGCTFDTNREFATCDPEYYRWTQELFLKLYDNGLLYQKETFVNWDPVDQTVLADEQVDENNRSWRSGAIVEKRLLRQWFVKTTVFAQSLLDGLKDKTLKEWRDIIKLQEHWIGECTGTNFDFKVVSKIPGYPKSITLWTDRPAFIEYASFFAVSSNNLFSKIEKSESRSPVRLLNAKVINPFTNKELPVFVTEKESLPYPEFREDYLGIPCSSEADVGFCKSVGIKYEIAPVCSAQELKEKRASVLQLARERNIGGHMVSSKLRDWLISRQRYWGTPIPIIHCEKCGAQPVPRSQLPVVLPKLDQSLEKQNSTLSNAKVWLNTSCPKCDGPAKRETDTMDTFVDSSWYFMRYIDPKNDKEMFSKDKAFRDMPVDLYIGGKEHAVLHLYYARFVNHFLYQLGLVPTREPFKQLLVQGMVMGQSFSTKEGRYLKPHEIEATENGYVEKDTNQRVIAAWEKMSKSKYNGVDPSKMFDEHSIDTIRLLMLADVAPRSHRNWSKETFPGILNWQHRLWQTVSEFIKARKNLTPADLSPLLFSDQTFLKEDASMFDSRNYHLHGVTFNLTVSQQLSVAISKMQSLTNKIRKSSKLCVARSREYERALAVQIIMLAPIAPHFASELWAGFCSAPNRIVEDGEIDWDKDVLEQRWPEVDMEYELKVDVTVNDKKFVILRIPRRQLDTMSQEEVLELAVKEQKFQKHLQKHKIIRVYYKSKSSSGAQMSIKTKESIDKKVLQKEGA